MRKVFLDNLPKRNNRRINWKMAVGYKVDFIYDDISGVFEIVEWLPKDINNTKTRLEILYNGNKYKILSDSFQKCKICSILGKRKTVFQIEVGDIFNDNKRTIEITMQIPNTEKYTYRSYKFKCHKCGWDEGILTEYEIFRGYGCSCCSSKTIVRGINDIPTTNNWMIKYFQGDAEEAALYTANSNKKIYFICPDCGKIKTKSVAINNLYRTHSIGCSCGDGISYPEKFMMSILSQLGIEYLTEYSPEWANRKFYDFYLPEYKIIIEMDGGLGHGRNLHSKSKLSVEETIEIDRLKDELAAQNRLNVLRIDSNISTMKFLADEIKNKLSTIFDIKTINWELCNEYALGNRVKELCIFYENNKPITATEVSKHFKTSISTACRWLIKGSEIGWCLYDKNMSEDFKIEALRKHTLETMSKAVSVYYDDKYLGTYKSCSELSRKSIDDFGVRFFTNYICATAKGKIKQYKGYTIRYAI